MATPVGKAGFYRLLFPEGRSVESMSMTPLGNDLYRLEETSVSETGIYYHDVIEATGWFGNRRTFRRVTERSGLRVFFFLLTQELTESEAFDVFLRRVTAHGGHWESLFGGLLFIHLPRRSPCRPKSEIRALSAGLSRTEVEHPWETSPKVVPHRLLRRECLKRL